MQDLGILAEGESGNDYQPTHVGSSRNVVQKEDLVTLPEQPSQTPSESAKMLLPDFTPVPKPNPTGISSSPDSPLLIDMPSPSPSPSTGLEDLLVGLSTSETHPTPFPHDTSHTTSWAYPPGMAVAYYVPYIPVAYPPMHYGVGKAAQANGTDTTMKTKDGEKSGAFAFMNGKTNSDAFDFVQNEIAAKLP